MIYRIYFTEMSFNRDRVMDKIRDLSYNICYHILKCISFEYSEYVDGLIKHWYSELKRDIILIQDMTVKPKHTLLKYKDYLQVLLNEWLLNEYKKSYSDSIYSFIKNIKMKYKKLNPRIINEIDIDFIVNFLKTICDMLSKDLINYDSFDQEFLKLMKNVYNIDITLE